MRDVNISDLEALREFRSHLVTFNNQVADSFAGMRTHSHGIRESWDDAKYQQFIEAFEEVSRGIERYLSVTDDHERYLAELIERIQWVLDTRIS